MSKYFLRLNEMKKASCLAYCGYVRYTHGELIFFARPKAVLPLSLGKRMAMEMMDPDPLVQFETWFEEAKVSELTLPEAVALATATRDGQPSVRMVLVKQYDRDGFVFFTNRESRKADELAANPRAALVYHWKSLGRQVRIEGSVEPVSDDVSKAYFDSRPRRSRLSAWASPQSKAISDREFLENRMAELARKYPGDDVPLPPFWGGYRVIPEQFEFWISIEDRLHDRFLYVRQSDGEWTHALLAP